MNCYLASNLLLSTPVFLITLIDIIQFCILLVKNLRQIKIQSCSSISLPKNDKKTQIENIHHNISNKKCEAKILRL